MRTPAWVVVSGILAAATPGLHAQARGRTEPPVAALKQMDTAIEGLADRVSPSVVQVVVAALGSGSTPERTGVVERQRVIGSGVILDSAGFIITNAHVVTGAARVRVVFTPAAGRQSTGLTRDAHLVGVDNETDLALLKVDTTGLPALRFGDSDQLRKGQLVFAFGSPVGLSNSVTMGVVSSVAREVDPNRPVVFIQTDASINPGNSGGALVDAEGALVGVNTLILTQSGGSEGLGFAIPSGIVELVYHQLRSSGRVHRGIIGVRADEITPVLAAGLGLARDWGLVLEDVAPGSPAALAGLAIGDVVVALNGKPVGGLAEFITDLTLRNMGRTAHLDIVRGTQALKVDVPVVERPDNLDRLVGTLDPEKSLVRRLGILGVTIDPTVGGSLPPLRQNSGVLVVARALYAGTIETGLTAGDVIHAVNGAQVTTLDELRSALRDLKSGAAAVLQIERQGAFMFLPFEVD